MQNAVWWTDLFGVIRNACGVREWLHDTSCVPHDLGSVGDTSKWSKLLISLVLYLYVLLYQCLCSPVQSPPKWTVWIWISNGKGQQYWVHACREKAGTGSIQTRKKEKSSVHPSFIIVSSGVSYNHVWKLETVRIFYFPTTWYGAHIEGFNVQKTWLVWIWGTQQVGSML